MKLARLIHKTLKTYEVSQLDNRNIKDVMPFNLATLPTIIKKIESP